MQRLHVVHERAEPERVARHEDEPGVPGLDPQGAAVGGAQGERLLDHDVAAALDRLCGDLDVRAGVRRDDDGVDRAGGQRLAERRRRAGERVDTEERLAQVLAEVDQRDHLDIGERRRRPDHLRAPVAAADERDPHLASVLGAHATLRNISAISDGARAAVEALAQVGRQRAVAELAGPPRLDKLLELAADRTDVVGVGDPRRTRSSGAGRRRSPRAGRAPAPAARPPGTRRACPRARSARARRRAG